MDLKSLDGLKTAIGIVVFGISDILLPVHPEIATTIKVVGLGLAALGLIHKRQREKELFARMNKLENKEARRVV